MKEIVKFNPYACNVLKQLDKNNLPTVNKKLKKEPYNINR